MMELCTPSQIANFSIAVHLATMTASGTQGSITGLSVAWQPTSLNARRDQSSRKNTTKKKPTQYFSSLWCFAQVSVSKSPGRGRQVLTLIDLGVLNDDLEEQAEDAGILGILITALQGQVEAASNIGRLAVTQLEHLWVAEGAREVVLHPLLFPFAVGKAVVVEKHTCSHVGRDHKLPCHELIFWKAQRVVWGHQGD